MQTPSPSGGRRAMIAMSGGVDSSVAVHLMQRQGYVCQGVTMRLLDQTDSGGDAAAVARQLGVPFTVLDCRAAFQAQVIEPFVRTYEAGGTPNPCIQCNRHLKFDHLLTYALAQGAEVVATGHYARVEARDGRFLLKKARFADKDQSYVLYHLNQHQLAHVRFPLGELEKAQVREMAEALGFGNAQKQDSQDICFIPDGDYGAFLERYTGKTYAPGAFLDADGAVVGRHRGAVRYTLGQRKGLGLAMGEPVYVCAKSMADNTVTVGPEALLFTDQVWAEDFNWIPFPALTAPMRVTARTRYRQREQAATVYPPEGGRVRVEFDQPQRAVTPGQALVLYDGELVVGGGTIVG